MGLLEEIKRNENSRKIFGKRETKIIEKQLLGVKLTQSEKNRLSRDIRKKLEFIGKICRFSEEFRLKKGAEISKIINESKEIILENILARKIKRILLFGSVVRNDMTFKSDIDIAVEFDKITGKEAALFRKRIMGKVNERVDVQVFNLLPNKLKQEIEKEGRILHKK